MKSTVRLALLGSVSSAAAVFLLPASADAQNTTCSQTGTTVTCVEGTTTVLTATVPATTVTVPGPGLTSVNAGGTAAITYTATGPIATTANPAIVLTTLGSPLSFTPTTGTAAVNIATTGANAPGLTLNGNGQAVTATVGNITTTGANSSGVVSIGDSNLTLTTGNISATGTGSIGIDAQGETGTVAITAGNITANGRGVRAFTDGANTVVVGNVASGDRGISALGSSVAITAGTVNVVANANTVPNAFGVVGQSSGGNVTITTGAVTSNSAGGAGVGGNVTGGTGSVVIRTGAVSVIGNSAIFARATNATGGIDIGGCPSVGTTGNGSSAIFADVQGTGTATINCGTVTTTGDNATGVFVRSGAGNIAVTTTSVATSGAGSFGISANTAATGTVTTNAGAITTTGVGSTGLFIAAGTGAIDAGYGNITTSGIANGEQGANALNIGSNGTVNLRGATATTTSTLRTNGAGVTAAAINAAGVTGNLGNVTTTGTNAAGAVITSTAPVNLTIGTVATTGNGVTLNAGANAVTLTTGAVTATTAGATGTVVNSTGAVTFNGGRQAANGANALRITGGAGAINATVAGAATTGTGNAIVITSTGPVTLTDTAATTTTGNNSDAINVATTGAITIASTNVSTVGTNSRGIVANGGGAVSVTSAAGTTTGANAPLIVANSTGSSVAVTLTGSNVASNSEGVVAQGATTVALNVAAAGALQSNLNAANLTSATGTTVTNAGSINGTVAALTIAGGSATINNSGTITGRLLTTANADTFNNSGTFNGPGGSDFGAGNDTVNNSGTYNANGSATFGNGTDTFNNSGTLNVLRSATAAGTVTFTSLEAFNNSGLIDLRNGRVGDTLVLPGTYVGTAGRLGLDASLGVATGTADILRVGGIATGTTTITLNQLNTTPAVLSTAAGTLLVQAGGPSAGGAFALDTTQIDQGLIQYNIVYNPTNFAYSLVATPGVGVFRTARVAQGARNLWLQSSDAWSGHMRELRDNVAASGAGGSGGRVWGQIIGQVESRTGTRALSYNGVTALFNTGVRQDYFGGQLGVDFGGPAGDSKEAGGFAFGVTGGYLSSILNFNGSADRVKYDAVNGGLYATYSGGIFFLNVLGKYDYIWGNNRSVTGRFSQKIDGSVYGGRAEAGFRLGNTFFIEPSASVSYTHSDIDDFTTLNGSFSFDDRDGVRGKGGARIGTVLDNGPSKVTLYAGGNYVHEFKDRDGVTFVSGGQTVAFRQGKTRDYGEGLVGVNVGSDAGKVSGFIEGRYANGGDYDGFGGRAGMRFRF